MHKLLLSSPLLLAFALSTACNGTNPAKPAAVEGTATDTAADKAAAPGDAKPVGPCIDYASKVCDAAGAKTATCDQFKAATELMSDKTCQAGIADLATTLGKIKATQAVCSELVTRLCAALGPKTKTCAMVTEKTKSFPTERCKEMGSAEGFPKVLEQLQQMEAANKPLSAEVLAKIHGADGASSGDKDAKVTIVEFSDFQCPYCVRASSAVSELKKKYGAKVRFIFRHFPLDFHKEAHAAAQASMFANSKGKFWEFHDLLFENQKALKPADLEKYATKLGLSAAALKTALSAGTYKAAVDADMALGKAVGVRGTPTMFLNGTRVENPTDAAVIGRAIDAVLTSP
ncbi:MAG: thioredoxin domain-containing protein [Myxococcota bacterium]|nr:thioredoxin domain-containing protein [Myxococcota bacterium]